MHELGITRNIVAIVSEKAVENTVKRVQLQIGTLSGIIPDSVRFCFDICAKDTPLEGASLEIDEIKGLGKCLDCGKEVPMQQVFSSCFCGSRKLKCIAGKELNIKEFEIY